MTSAPRRRARLLSYALWQCRDYAINIAAISIVLFGLLGMLEVMNLRSAAIMIAANRGFAENLARMQQNSFQQLFSMYATVGPIVALSGVVSQDRSLGYVRFLFAKPLNPISFYLQSFVVRAFGFFVVGGVLLLAYNQFEPSAELLRIAAGLGLAFLAYGGMLFLWSVLSKYDGLCTVAFLLLSVLVWGKWGVSKGLGHVATYAFPPVDKFSGLDAWVSNVSAVDPAAAAVFPTKWVVWTVCYGVACLVLGVVLLRKRPLASA